MADLKDQMQDYFLQYASYVILDRAIPNIVDGLKPVQRRILHTLYGMDDGKLHKVANVAGQTMALHPHGDGPIIDALVNLANKNYLMDKQGNFGNLYTGDPAAAARYIETRLSKMAKETLFNPEITPTIPSYDSRNQEPIYLPAKIPLLLMQGTEGIAVGMATRILPHNFKELLEAEISILEGKEIVIYPDFLTGGLMDASEYDQGRGKVRLRARIEILDEKHIIIRDICHGTTTESLIESIDDAAKKGKIKIESIHDYTSDKVEIEITLPRGQYADKVVEALYAFTEAQVSLSSQVVVIQDKFPLQTTIQEILKVNASYLMLFIQKELELDKQKLIEKIFHKTLERIFIENRLYKKLEIVKSEDVIDQTVAESLLPFHKLLYREPLFDDRQKLLAVPIRRITLFDLSKNLEEIAKTDKELDVVDKKLKNLKKTAIDYLKKLLEKYGDLFPRKTEMTTLHSIDLKQVSTKKIKIFVDGKDGFIGTKVSGAYSFECTNFDKLLLLFKDGSYTVSSVKDKHFIGKEELVFVGPADKKTIFSVLYKDLKGHVIGKRFIISKFILDKTYRFLEEGANFEALTSEEKPKAELFFKKTARLKASSLLQDFTKILIKGVSAKGVRLSEKPLSRFIFNSPTNLACIACISTP